MKSRLNGCDRLRIGVEIFLFASQEVSSLARLGVLDSGTQILNRLDGCIKFSDPRDRIESGSPCKVAGRDTNDQNCRHQKKEEANLVARLIDR